MGGTVKIIIEAIGLAATFAPYAIKGVEALYGAIKATQAEKKPISHASLLQMADAHGVDLDHVGTFISTLTPKGT